MVLIYLSHFDGKIYPIVWNFVFGWDWVLLLVQIQLVWNVHFNHFKHVMGSIHLFDNDTCTLLWYIKWVKRNLRKLQKCTRFRIVGNLREISSNPNFIHSVSFKIDDSWWCWCNRVIKLKSKKLDCCWGQSNLQNIIQVG